MESERCASGIYHSLFLNEQHCGYAISLNSADQLKNIVTYLVILIVCYLMNFRAKLITTVVMK